MSVSEAILFLLLFRVILLMMWKTTGLSGLHKDAQDLANLKHQWQFWHSRVLH